MTTVWRSATKYIVGIGLVVFGLWVVYLSRPVIPLLIFAGLVALIVSPVTQFLQTRLRAPGWLAISVSYVLFLVVLAALLGSLVTSLEQTIQAVEAASGSFTLNGLVDALQRLRSAQLPLPALNAALSSAVDRLLAAIRGLSSGGPATITLPELPPSVGQSLGQSLLNTFVIGISGLGAVLSVVTSLTLIIVLAVYLSFSNEWLYRSFMDKVPSPYRPEIAGVLSRIRTIWAGYLRGQIYLQLLVGALVWLGLTVLGVPGALGLGFVAAILYLVPNVGMLLAAVPAALLAAVLGSSHFAIGHGVFALVVVAYYVLLIELVGTFAVPIVMKTSLNLNPLIFTVAILVGAAAAGVLGTVLAAPVLATGQVVIGYLYGKLLQQPGSEEDLPHDDPV
jgi:predicted PurR-regulated permease PerM